MLYDHFRSENRSLDAVAVLLEAIQQRQIFYFSRLFHTISLLYRVQQRGQVLVELFKRLVKELLPFMSV